MPDFKPSPAIGQGYLAIGLLWKSYTMYTTCTSTLDRRRYPAAAAYRVAKIEMPDGPIAAAAERRLDAPRVSPNARSALRSRKNPPAA